MSNKKSIVDIPTVNKIARLARLEIPEKNKQNLTNDLNNILEFVAQLNEVDTSNVEPLASVTGHKLPMRSDEVTDGNIEELVLKNAPESSSGFFVVPSYVRLFQVRHKTSLFYLNFSWLQTNIFLQAYLLFSNYVLPFQS